MTFEHEYDGADYNAGITASIKKDKKIMRHLKKKLPPSWFKIIKLIMDDNTHNYDLNITSVRGGEKDGQKYRFKHLFQTGNWCSYSDCGSGETWIPIKNGNYLHFHYTM